MSSMRFSMNGSPRLSGGTLAGLLMAVGLLSSVTAYAEYFIVPSVSVVGLYDDNLFFTLEDEESDFITRVSPALELGYESTTLTWSGRYSVDAERYRKHSELNSNTDRRFADVAVEFLPSSRLTLAFDAAYARTDTPVDLSLVPGGPAPGLLIGRAKAERTSANPSVRYRFSPLVTGSLAYTYTHDELAGVQESDTDTAEMDIEQKLSRKNAITYGYRYRRYRIDNAPAQAAPTSTSGSEDLPGLSPLLGPDTGFDNATSTSGSEDTHTPWLGLSHEFSPDTGAVGRAGPRISDDSTDPYLLFALRHQYPTGEILVEYLRDETIVLGEGTRQEFQSVSVTMSRQFGLNLDIRVIPSYARISQHGDSPEIYGLSLEGIYRISNAVFLTAGYDFSYQQVGSSGGGADEITRGVFQLGITFTYPRRTREEGKSSNHDYYERLQELGFPGEKEE